MRPQRDLFTGAVLGIPDVNTHVGSVIHAFETMASQRDSKSSNKPSKNTKRRIESGHGHGHHRISLPAATHIYSQTDTLTDPSHMPTVVAHREYFIEQPIYDSSNYRSVQTVGNNTATQQRYSQQQQRNYHQQQAQAQQQYQSSINSNQTRIPVINKKRDNLDAKAITIESRTITEQTGTSGAGAGGVAKKHHNNADLFSIIGTTPTVQLSDGSSSAAVEETSHNLENDFIRGSTVSQSFIKNVKSSRSGNRTYEQSVTKITKHPSTSASVTKVGGTPVASGDVQRRGSSGNTLPSVSKLERRTRARSSGDDVMQAKSRDTSRSRSKSNERRKTYQPSTLDRAEL